MKKFLIVLFLILISQYCSVQADDLQLYSEEDLQNYTQNIIESEKQFLEFKHRSEQERAKQLEKQKQAVEAFQQNAELNRKQASEDFAKKLEEMEKARKKQNDIIFKQIEEQQNAIESAKSKYFEKMNDSNPKYTQKKKLFNKLISE